MDIKITSQIMNRMVVPGRAVPVPVRIPVCHGRREKELLRMRDLGGDCAGDCARLRILAHLEIGTTG
jgi:hypothetical protein